MTIDAVKPRVGCGASIIDNGKVLLVRRRREPEAGCWGLPGGKVDPFERVADAVAREILEELGIAIEPIDLLCVVDQIDRARGQHWIAPVSIPVWLRQHRDAQENMGVVVIGHLVRPALAFAGLIVELQDRALDLAKKVPERDGHIGRIE